MHNLLVRALLVYRSNLEVSTLSNIRSKVIYLYEYYKMYAYNKISTLARKHATVSPLPSGVPPTVITRSLDAGQFTWKTVTFVLNFCLANFTGLGGKFLSPTVGKSSLFKV